MDLFLSELERHVEEQRKSHEQAVERLSSKDKKLITTMEMNRTLQDKIKEHVLRGEVIDRSVNTYSSLFLISSQLLIDS